ncbi:2,3-diketo-5-methylthiopentyl-1-phosphate enolase [Polycladomyces subterraneus]|uniref:2,3-diketo-5-methylthiopentyl-1-phosphate enolase n=1 Tax=Polycladomyces subterraneus TaxID=1016997 RepID=A0ABT8IN78_9BACL|nr:2,3-diketo-5-methylthiopentyl-1-phosphate enolase [Polycladomyces subterraneus]MDN4594260.1 2,3-diketo-5-methylthiopentyl-1-phosphate enolase [Polycladomyces subterraneus]
MDSGYIYATYLIQGASDLEKKARGIAVGLTVGTWTELPRAKQEKMAPYLGKVEEVARLEPAVDGTPRGRITIGYPVRNLTADLPAVLTTVFGKLSMDGKIKLIDLQLPDEFLSRFPGPRFGIEGIRERLGVHDRPLLMSIFKQCIGLPLDELETEYQKQIEGGVDLVKDDEIFFRDDLAPVEQRVSAIERRNRAWEEQTGKKVLYAVNLTGPVTQLLDRAKRLVEAGASCLLLNVAPYGWDVLHRLAEDPDISVPIMAHPAFTGAIYASPDHGLSAALLLGKFLRWAGADIVLYPSPYGSVAMPREEALKVAQHLRENNGAHRPAFPAPSAGIHPGLVPVLYRDFGRDAIVNAGGGIHGHPDGSTQGGRAFVDAIKAVVSGVTLEEKAETSAALRKAIDAWGVVKA